jgi:ribonuclease BN (tRNA processing enzyme)
MRYEVLGCFGGETPGCRLSSFLLDGTLLIDTGSATAALEIASQARIDHVLLTHSHLDHSRGLAHLADNVFGLRTGPVGVYSIEPVLDGLKASLLNNVLWPDFTEIVDAHGPVLTFQSLPEDRATLLGPFAITPVRVHHTVACVAYLVERDGRAVLHIGDTGPTDQVWRVARQARSLTAVVVETSFPSRLQRLAEASSHLTPHTLEGELVKLSREVPVFVYHLKPQFITEIQQEIRERFRSRIRILEQGATYEF